jgi:hypothetical protein
MLIQNKKTKETWDIVILYLKPSEAKQLRDYLEALLDDPIPGEHHHVSSEDYRREITVLISDKE